MYIKFHITKRIFCGSSIDPEGHPNHGNGIHPDWKDNLGLTGYRSEDKPGRKMTRVLYRTV